MTAAETFAQNLREEMFRQRIGQEELITRIRRSAKEEARAEGRQDYDLSWCDQLVYVAVGFRQGPPLVGDDIAELASALGCPVERLTVSREELERRCEESEGWGKLAAERAAEISMLKQKLQHWEKAWPDLKMGRDVLAQELAKSEARVAELETALAKGAKR